MGVQTSTAFACFKVCFPPLGSLASGALSPHGRPGEEQVHCFHVLTVPDLPLLPPNSNGKMCFLEIIFKTEKRRENEWWPVAWEGKV